MLLVLNVVVNLRTEHAIWPATITHMVIVTHYPHGYGVCQCDFLIVISFAVHSKAQAKSVDNQGGQEVS